MSYGNSLGDEVEMKTKLRAPNRYNLRADLFERGTDAVYYALLMQITMVSSRAKKRRLTTPAKKGRRASDLRSCLRGSGFSSLRNGSRPILSGRGGHR